MVGENDYVQLADGSLGEGVVLYTLSSSHRASPLALRGAKSSPRTSGICRTTGHGTRMEGKKEGRRLCGYAREGGRLWENRVGHGVARTHASVPAVGGCRVALCRRLRQSS